MYKSNCNSDVIILVNKFGPLHDKTNTMTCAPSEDSDQPGHPPSLLLRSRHANSEDSDQTGRMPRLIWVFDGRTDHFVGFVVRRLIYDVIVDKALFLWITLN